jgi:colanic acid/amylovoran biosynthesis protein
MRILLIGQCTVHWGRLEFGNIGNYYIVEPTIRELHRVFPAAEIVTTFQMTDEFCVRERVTCLPMELFYSWSENDVWHSLQELGVALMYQETKKLISSTPFIEEVLKSDLIIDLSGEMWGDHAEPVGKDRFLVGLIKVRIAQLCGKPVVLLASSEGPFSDEKVKIYAQTVLKNYRLVANREPASFDLLQENGFEISNVKTFADPAFLFDPKSDEEMREIYIKEKISIEGRKTVGFVLCGFNLLQGPYDKWPRKDEEYEQFADAIEYIVNQIGARVVLFSHQNGFELPPHFKLINGRDFSIVKQLQTVVEKRGKTNMEHVLCIENPYLPYEIKAIIKQFDMVVTGRVHALVAALSQYVPSVLINRGFGPPSHRNLGFARSVGIEEYIANPASAEDLKIKIQKCWDHRDAYRVHLNRCIPFVKETARKSFDAVAELITIVNR